MNTSFALPIALVISLFTIVIHKSPLSPFLPQCGHIVLISSHRHGSSWFLDSAEGCPSRRSASGKFGELIKNSELWLPSQAGPVRDISPTKAAEYARRNNSLKFFPLAYRKGPEAVKQFFEGVKEQRLPVFVLNRNLEDSYASFVEAREKHDWNRILPDGNEGRENRVVVKDKYFSDYLKKHERFFAKVKILLKEVELEWDRLDYEEVHDMKNIVGIKNRCFIRNCNFVPER